MPSERAIEVSTAAGQLGYSRLSRRQFVYRSAAAVVGFSGLELLRPIAAFSASGSDPTPIPGGIRLSDFTYVPTDPDIHVFLPAEGSEIATITNFNGLVAAAEIQGSATGSDGSHFGFDADMRLMEGAYVGKDGRLRQGSFGFIWIDLFEGAVGGPQVHDFEPGIAPSGLFWTVPVPSSSIDISGGSGRARFHLENVSVPDFGDFFNAISPSPDPPPVPSHVSFDVRWQGGGDRLNVRDASFGFAGDYISGNATISFSVANDGGVTYTSVAAGQQTVAGAVGHERNGVFFK